MQERVWEMGVQGTELQGVKRRQMGMEEPVKAEKEHL